MKDAQNADEVRHKIVEHAVGLSRFSCRCLCGWSLQTSSLKQLDRLAERHIDGQECK